MCVGLVAKPLHINTLSVPSKSLQCIVQLASDYTSHFAVSDVEASYSQKCGFYCCGCESWVIVQGCVGDTECATQKAD